MTESPAPVAQGQISQLLDFWGPKGPGHSPVGVRLFVRGSSSSRRQERVSLSLQPSWGCLHLGTACHSPWLGMSSASSGGKGNSSVSVGAGGREISWMPLQ